MEEQIYSMDSVLNGINGYENKTPADLIEKSGSREIFKLIKRGYRFDDEVLSEAHIGREIRDDRVYWEVVPHNNKSKKELKKDEATYEEIVESLSHVEVDEEEQKNDEEEENGEEFFENDDDE